MPIVPAIPNLPLPSRASKQASIAVTSDVVNGAPSNADHLANAVETAAKVNAVENGDPVETLSSPPVKAAPKSWADLVRTMGQNSTAKTAQATFDSAPKTDTFVPGKAGSLADALSSYSVKDSNENAKIAFLEPRGLVNTGNMCYMNSVSPRCTPEFLTASKCFNRSCRSLFFVYHATTFSRRLEDKRHIVSKAILH